MTSFEPKMLVDCNQRIQHINSSYLATLLLKLWHPIIYEETFHVNSSSNNEKYFKCRVYKKQRLQQLSGRYQTLIWRPEDTVQNLESPGLSSRVDSTAYLIRLFPSLLHSRFQCRHAIQRSSPLSGECCLSVSGEERCVTTLKMAVQQTTMEDKNPWNGYGKPSFHILNLSKCSDVA